jgi:hypothetical protein
MFTTIDKALVALIMAVLYLLSNYFGINLGFTETQVAGFVTFLVPILVWLIPNKK